MQDKTVEAGKSIAPISSLGIRSMRVTDERGKRRRKNGKKESKRHTCKDIETVVQELNEAMAVMNKPIRFSMVTRNGQQMVTMADVVTGGIIQEIIAEELHETSMSDLLGVIIDREG